MKSNRILRSPIIWIALGFLAIALLVEVFNNAGGYTDMLAQRGKGIEARKTEKSAPAPKKETSAAPAPKVRSKLSFKDKHALETLPGRIDALSEEAKRLHAVLDDPGLYARDPKLFASATEKLTATEAALAAAEEEWLRLEMLREELEG